MSIYRRVFRYYRPFLPQTIVGLLLSLLGVGVNLLKVWPFKIIVDDFLRPNPTPRGDPHTWIPLLCLALVVIQFFWESSIGRPIIFWLMSAFRLCSNSAPIFTLIFNRSRSNITTFGGRAI